jgi:radical SAM protein (TIGR04043 family)
MAAGEPQPGPVRAELGPLLTELQSAGVRVDDTGVEGRRGGAGPSDAAMIWVEGIAVTFPFASDYVSSSPFVLRPEGEGWALYRLDQRVGSATIPPRPKFYDLTTADGIPYWKIALLHLDSLASTVIQTCAYWDTPDQCRFCGIEVSLQAGRTTAVKRPEHMAEVALAAKELDGAVDVTLTTGSTRARDRGALYVARCARAIKDATGLPIQAQFEPPEDLDVLEQVKALGVDSVGIHIETFDPQVFAWVAPAKARTGVEGYFRAWQRAVDVFGRGQVSTYVILGMGEDPHLTVDGCKRAVDLGVYPFIVPLRPVPGSLMQDLLPPPPAYVESMYRQVVPHLLSRGLAAAHVRAGCARCNACSAMSAFERAQSDVPTSRRLRVLGAG